MKVIDIIDKQTKYLQQKKRALKTLQSSIKNMEQEIKLLTELNRKDKSIKRLKNGSDVKLEKVEA